MTNTELQFKTVYYGDPLLTQFCNDVIETEMDTSYHHWWTDERMKKIFHNVELCLVNNKVISFSGCSINNNRLRIAQQHYTLLEYRKDYRDILIRKDGFIDRHIKTAIDLDLHKLLITIHTFNKKTKYIERIYRKKRHLYRHLKDFEYVGVEKVNYVNQHCYEKII